MRNEETIDIGDIETFYYCGHAFYLDKIVKEQNLPMPGHIAKKAFLKNAFRDLIPDERRLGRELLLLEEIKPEELGKYLKYKSPESFANAMRGRWIELIINQRGKVHGREIVWAFKNQWWKIAHEIWRNAKNYYEHLLSEGMHITDFDYSREAFDFEGKRYLE